MKKHIVYKITRVGENSVYTMYYDDALKIVSGILLDIAEEGEDSNFTKVKIKVKWMTEEEIEQLPELS